MKPHKRFIEAACTEPVASRVRGIVQQVNTGVTQLVVTAIATLLLVTGRAAAVHGSLPCDPPSQFDPLFQLLHSIGVLATAGGIALGAISLMIAGILYVLPGHDYTQRAKSVAKNGIIGVAILLSAGMVVAFLVSQLGASLC